MSSTSSDDEMIGAEAEQEYENSLESEPVEKEKPKQPSKRVRLTNSQRLQLIDGFRQGKTDKFYNVIPNKNKPGDYRIVRRRKPLNVPIADNNPEPINMNIEQPLPEKNISTQPVKDDKNRKMKQEFFTMQNTINNSLSKEIAAVMEKCNKIEAKMKKQKAQMKQQRAKRVEPVAEYEYEYEEEQPEQYQQPQHYSRFNVRNRIDLRNF